MKPERVRYGSRGQGALIRYAGSKNWFSCYFVNGREHTETTGCDDLKLARRWHKHKLDEISSQRQGHAPVVTPAMKHVTIRELLDALFETPEFKGLKSAYTTRCHAAPVRVHFGDWRAANLTAEAWDTYIEKRRGEGAANATVNRERAVVLSAFGLAVRRHRLNKHQVPELSRLPERNVRRGFFERDEFERVVAHLPEYLRDAAWWAYWTGWRRGDVRDLMWRDVDTRAMTVILPETKNGEGRCLPLPEELAEIIKRREQARLIETPGGDVKIADRVFHYEGGKPLGDFRRAWESACIAAGLFHVEKDETGKETKVKDKLWHDFRRTGARNLRRAGVDETVAMRITGHKTASVFRRYNIVDERDLRLAMKAAVEYQAS